MFSSLKAKLKRLLKTHAAPVYIPVPDPAGQKILTLIYQEKLRAGHLTDVRDTGLKVFSQTDEDGILLYLLSVIGFGKRLSVEICAGNGQECNTTNLIINHGFHGLLVDGNETLVQQGAAFFASHPSTYVFPPIFIAEWVTRENVNDVVEKQGFKGEIDVFSLDMDGIDYWVWKALDVISPRIVVLEYSDFLGPDVAVTVPYQANFNGYEHPAVERMPVFAGASLRAFANLAKDKGYRLVATNTLGYNAFFVRNDVPEAVVPTIKVEDCFVHPKVLDGVRRRLPISKELPWERV